MNVNVCISLSPSAPGRGGEYYLREVTKWHGKSRTRQQQDPPDCLMGRHDLMGWHDLMGRPYLIGRHNTHGLAAYLQFS